MCFEKCPEIDLVLDECRSIVDLATFQLIPSIAPYIENYNCSDPRTYHPDIPSDTRISNASCSKLVCILGLHIVIKDTCIIPSFLFYYSFCTAQ